ncbi:DoxX family protein [Tessaracoccus sp. Z1128]
MSFLFKPASSVSPTAVDIALLVARVALGAILFAHGWQKYMQYTLAGTTAAFADMGVPLAAVAATVVATAEIVGGILLVIGALTRVAAAVNAVTLTGALFLVHAPNGVFIENNGVELVLGLAAGLVLLAVLGGGRFAVDGLLTRTRGAAQAERVSVAAAR